MYTYLKTKKLLSQIFYCKICEHIQFKQKKINYIYDITTIFYCRFATGDYLNFHLGLAMDRSWFVFCCTLDTDEKFHISRVRCSAAAVQNL
jgi:hypothetical protein